MFYTRVCGVSKKDKRDDPLVVADHSIDGARTTAVNSSNLEYFTKISKSTLISLSRKFPQNFKQENQNYKKNECE